MRLTSLLLAGLGLFCASFLSAQTPCENGFAAGYPCDLVDLMGLVPSSDMGGGDAEDLWGWTDPQDGKEYAIVGMAGGTAFVDVTDPTAPVVLGTLPSHTGSSLWRDVKVHADHAFIVSEASGHGLQVFDLTRLRNVASPPATFTEDAHYAGFGNCHNIAINEASGRAYAVGSNTFSGGLHILNISTPTAPTLIGSFAEDGYTHDAQIVMYTGPDADHTGKEVAFAFNENSIAIVDVTNAGDPVMISNTGYSASAYTHQGWLTEDQRYLLVNDELDEDGSVNTRTYIFDVFDLDAPVLIGTHLGSTSAIDHNLYNHEGYCYQANYRAGLRILDLADVGSGSLTEVAHFDVYPSSNSAQFNGAWSVYPFFASGNLIVSHIEEGLFILRANLSNPPQGVLGCTNAAACNFDPAATSDDGSCVIVGAPCDDGDALTLGDVYTDCAAPGFGCQGSGPMTIWEETFGNYPSLSYGYNGNTNTAASETEWSITFGSATDYFFTQVQNGDTVFAGKDLDFDCTWTTRGIDVAGFTDLEVSLNVSEVGNWENTDFFRLEAIVDGATVELFNVINDFGSITVGPLSIPNGEEIQLRVVTRTNANGERPSFDDVRLVGVPNCADADADGLCDNLDGCVDVTACNFDDPAATECLALDACGVCGGPGAVLECGCSEIPAGDCDCNGNQLDAIGVCGGDCPADSDSDGICDTEDECLGELDACGVCNGPGAIYECGCADIPTGDCDCNGNQLDAIGVCGGNCTADVDADGICDDVDDCVGALDACGVCNGPGAIYECGCADIPTGDCDCNGNQLDALGVCGGDCPGDADGDGICDTDEVPGCTDPNAFNYNDAATDDNGSCTYINGSFTGLTAELVNTGGAGPGLNTWRVYATFSNPAVDVLSVFGTAANPIDISSSTGWYQDPLGAATGNGINPLLFTDFPSLAYDSWVTVGAESSADGDITVVGLDLNAFEAGQDLTSDGTAGGSWIAIPGEVNGTSPDAQGRVLIAQLTTDGTIVFDCNLQYRESDGSSPLATELSLVFQNGCPEDINGSGMVDIDDILAVLTQFGCTGTCTGDLDGDGDVDVTDGLQVLGAFANLCN